MTQNQFMMAQLETQRQRDFRNWLEERRHNMAGEAETSLHNRNVESYNQLSLNESTRHNMAVEANDAARNELTRLHYERQDEINRLLAAENTRHNKTSETTEQLKALNSYSLGLLEQANQNRRTDIEEKKYESQDYHWIRSDRNDTKRNEIAEYDAKTRRKQFWVNTASTVLNTATGIVRNNTLSTSDAIDVLGKLF